MRVLVTLEDGTTRTYDVLSMSLVPAGEEVRTHIKDGVRGHELVHDNVIKVNFGKKGPSVSWDPTGDLGLGTDVAKIEIEK